MRKLLPVLACLIAIMSVAGAMEQPLFLSTMVARVVDGDTFHVSLKGRDETVRLIGVDTPETVHPDKPIQPYGPEASAFTKAELAGKAIFLEMDVQERDSYKRLLAYVWISKPTQWPPSENEIRSQMFNARLLLSGYAQLLTVPPNVKYVDRFTKFQKEAREANRGLWGLSAPKPTPTPVKTQITVYITNTGAKYHRYGCRYLARSCIPISLADAKAQGYAPCSVCGPPQ